MDGNIIKIERKHYPVFVKETLVGELDKTKCSHKFLMHNFPDDMVVKVKCYSNGELDLRGKKGEYRILISDDERKTSSNIKPI